MLPVPERLPRLSVASASRCPETGAFRFTFEVDGREVRADLTVAFLEDKGLAYLRHVTLDRVIDASLATERALSAWVDANQDACFDAALSAGEGL